MPAVLFDFDVPACLPACSSQTHIDCPLPMTESHAPLFDLIASSSKEHAFQADTIQVYVCFFTDPPLALCGTSVSREAPSISPTCVGGAPPYRERAVLYRSPQRQVRPAIRAARPGRAPHCPPMALSMSFLDQAHTGLVASPHYPTGATSPLIGALIARPNS